MGCEVYANGNEIACKTGDGKVIAAFPDVCNSPPSPPAGPIPLPYPNTSFSKDTKKGSKTVKIKKKEVMLKDKSFYKSSPLGDEAATKSFGANLISHTITGKTYFAAWSMDVKYEDKNVCRHIDITTSNHGSPNAGTPLPNPNLDAMATAKKEKAEDKCACCGQQPRMPGHSEGKPMTMNGFYGLSKRVKHTDGKVRLTVGAKARRKKMKEMITAYRDRGCGCKVFPEKPCNVHRQLKPGEKADIDDKWKDARRTPGFVESLGVDTVSVCLQKAGRLDLDTHPSSLSSTDNKSRGDILTKKRKVDHRTPRSGGGCPVGTGNLVAHENKLCSKCKKVDDQLGEWQSRRAQGLIT